MSIRVGVRHRNGKINHYEVTGVEWQEARAYVLSQVPSACVVLAVIRSSDCSAPTTEKAAA